MAPFPPKESLGTEFISIKGCLGPTEVFDPFASMTIAF
jgi:hypothetical protein